MSSDLPLGKKTYQHRPAKGAPHIGVLVKNYLKSNGIPAAKLARKLNRNPNTVAAYFKNPSIQLHILWEISHALEYNFLEEISGHLPEYFVRKPTPERLELERLRHENELLKGLLKR